jgi:hypothetical protein
VPFRVAVERLHTHGRVFIASFAQRDSSIAFGSTLPATARLPRQRMAAVAHRLGDVATPAREEGFEEIVGVDDALIGEELFREFLGRHPDLSEVEISVGGQR